MSGGGYKCAPCIPLLYPHAGAEHSSTYKHISAQTAVGLTPRLKCFLSASLRSYLFELVSKGQQTTTCAREP